MYIIVTSIAVCVFAAIINGIRFSLFPEPDTKIAEMTNEDRLRRIYRNAYYTWVSIKDEI